MTKAAVVQQIDHLRARLVETVERLSIPPVFLLGIMATLVGIGTGYVAVFFILGLRWVAGWTEYATHTWGYPALFFALILGGLLTAIIVVYLAPEAKGHGVPEVMMALITRGGRIAPRIVVLKVLGSMLTIGVGGSAGREGPIVQSGSALGSTVGQWFNMAEERLKVLVAAGAAGGIAAAFNAPIAGSIFALEVILGEFGIAYFGVVVIAAVAASIVSQAYLGQQPAFHVPAYGLNSPWELPFYLGLALLCALLAVFFIRLLYAFEDFFERWHIPELLKPIIGMVLTGAVALAFPQVLGPGLEFIGETIAENMQEPAFWLLALALAKLLATSFTLGAGNSGGVFAPSLFSGAALGGAFGIWVQHAFPQLPINPGAYALVGMSATFAGAARAPITAVLIVFEMSNDYRLILPLMFATVISTLVAHYLHPESIYTLKLVRRGITWRFGRDKDLMERIPVSEAMNPNPAFVPESMPARLLLDTFTETHSHGLPVLNSRGELVGVVTLTDYQKALQRSDFGQLRVGDIMTREVKVAYPDENLWQVLRRMGIHNIGRLPVVSRQNPKQLVGWIQRRDIIQAYNLALAKQEEETQRRQELALTHENGGDMCFEHVEITEDTWAAHKRIKDLPLPEDCLLVAIRRGRHVEFPHGDTVLRPGDRVALCTRRDMAEQVVRLLQRGPEAVGDSLSK